MTHPVRLASVALAAGAALTLAACADETAPEPAGEDTAAMMPDTSAPVAADGTAPDAGATGAAEPTPVPPDPDEPTT